jgi:hypothetical protein
MMTDGWSFREVIGDKSVKRVTGRYLACCLYAVWLLAVRARFLQTSFPTLARWNCVQKKQRRDMNER